MEHEVEVRPGWWRGGGWGVWDHEYDTWFGPEMYEGFGLRPDGTRETAEALAAAIREDRGM